MTKPGHNPVIKSFIQAGGRSSRMGQDKAWLEINGRPLIEHALEVAGSVSEQPAIIINANNPQAQCYRDLARRHQAEIIEDLYNHSGPLGGIYTALTCCRAEQAALILACDLPFVTTDFLALLWQLHQETEAALTVPLDRQRRVQMLAGIYSTECRAHLARMLAWHELQTDRLCLRATTRLVSFNEYAHLPQADRLLINLNTPQDYRSVSSQPLSDRFVAESSQECEVSSF